jgi:hypothetical protein
VNVNTFKRTTTTFQGGDVTITSGARRGNAYCPEQPVQIIREVPDNGNEDDDDRFEVEFYNLGRAIVGGEDLHPHPNARATNAEFMAWMVESATPNPLMQGFIPEAVAKYAEFCLDDPKQFEDKPHSIINGAAWLEMARIARDTITANYKS